MLTLTEKELFRLVLEDNIEEFKQKFESSKSFDKFCVNSDGVPLLGYAVQSNSPKTLSFLCRDEELKSFKGSKDTPAVHFVVDHMNPEVIEILKDNGFDFNALDRFGKNVLHVAARVCEHEDFVTLIQLGADIRQKSKRGETPKDTLKRWGNNKVRIRENTEELNY